MKKNLVFQFDENKVQYRYEYNKSQDKVVGPYNQALIVMARGLFLAWKQPVYLSYDTKLTKELLFSIIIQMLNADYTVVSCVSDCAGENIGLWKELSINIFNIKFIHPCTGNSICYFPNLIHLMKTTVHLPEDVITFVTQCLYIKLKYLNYFIKQKTFSCKRKDNFRYKRKLKKYIYST